MDSVNGWFAMSAPYRRELKASDLLRLEGMEYFLPMHYVQVDSGRGRKTRELRPAVPSLIFIKGSKEDVQSFKQRHGIVQYLTRPVAGRNEPIIVPDRQMDMFIKTVRNSLDNYLFFQPGELNLARGRKIKITAGALKGCEGTFIKVKGARNRRLVIILEGLGAIAAEVDPDYIELI